MAGLFPGICNTQNVDINGKPLSGAMLSVYNGGTTQLANCFQDIGLAIAGPNPMEADATGRLPIFYVADGVYRVVMTDANGVSVFDYPQVASIGPSASGGGGSSVDPTTIFGTGDPLWRPLGGARAGWVRMNARTIGSATSGASERANADCQNLFLHLWNSYPKLVVVGGRGASAAVDWAANKQITLHDMRGKGPFGLDGMGNTRANVLPDSAVTSSGDTGDSDAATGGNADAEIVQANLPDVDFNVNIPAGQGAHSHQFSYGTQQIAGVGGAGVVVNIEATGGSFTASTQGFTLPEMTGTAASGGTGAGLPVFNPFMTGTWYMKL